MNDFEKNDNNTRKYLSEIRLTHESLEIYDLYLSIQLAGSANDTIGLLIKKSIEMSKNPPYILRMSKYLYKNYYKISQNKLEIYSRKYKYLLARR